MRVCVQSQSSPFFNFEDPTLRMVDRQGASLAGARVAHCRHIVHLEPGEQSWTVSGDKKPWGTSWSLHSDELWDVEVQGDGLSWQKQVCVDWEEASYCMSRINLGDGEALISRVTKSHLETGRPQHWCQFLQKLWSSWLQLRLWASRISKNLSKLASKITWKYFLKNHLPEISSCVGVFGPEKSSQPLWGVGCLLANWLDRRFLTHFEMCAMIPDQTGIHDTKHHLLIESYKDTEA